MKRTIALTAALTFFLALRGFGAQVEAPVDVAPKAEGSRCQSEPAAAWSEGGKCWLAAWTEGYENEETAEIWCGRIGADGKALDPAGIRLAKGKGARGMPSVASDGKGFLVVWQDLRNGKAWNIYGARVTAEGKALDPDGFLVAGGEQSQALPAVAFAAGNYLVGWQALEGGVYDLFGVRVSPEGKVLDATPMSLTDNVSKRARSWKDRAGQAHSMGLAAFGDKVAVVGCVTEKPGSSDAAFAFPAGGAFDAGTGKALTPLAASSFLWRRGQLVEQSKRAPGSSSRAQNSRMYAAWSADGKGFTETFNSSIGDHQSSVGMLFYDGDGKELSGQRISIQTSQAAFALTCLSVACDGEQYLVVYQYAAPRINPPRDQLRGCYVSYDGKKLSEGDGFVIADDPAKSVVAGPVVAGPKGVCLVVHPDTRDFDNTKIVARLVKSK